VHEFPGFPKGYHTDFNLAILERDLLVHGKLTEHEGIIGVHLSINKIVEGRVWLNNKVGDPFGLVAAIGGLDMNGLIVKCVFVLRVHVRVSVLRHFESEGAAQSYHVDNNVSWLLSRPPRPKEEAVAVDFFLLEAYEGFSLENLLLGPEVVPNQTFIHLYAVLQLVGRLKVCVN